jgi:hypothetical protein
MLCCWNLFVFVDANDAQLVLEHSFISDGQSSKR